MYLRVSVNVVGSGYVGTTLAACLADFVYEVTAIDIDRTVVDAINSGKSPFHEPGFDELCAEHVGERLHATIPYDGLSESVVTFLAIGTPSVADGSIELGPLSVVAEIVGEGLAGADRRGEHLVVAKSTITPPGLADPL